MKDKKILLLTAVCFFLFETKADAVSFEPFVDDRINCKDIISAHAVIFNTPPIKTPSTVSVDGPLLGNGYTGVAIAGSPEKLTYYIARNDFWRLKSAYNESYPAVLGKLQLESSDLKDATYSVVQDLYTATTTATFTKKGTTLTNQTYVAAEDDLMVCRLESNRTLRMRVDLLLPDASDRVNNPPLDMLFPVDENKGKTSSGIYWLTRGFSKDVDIPTQAGISAKIMGGDELTEFVLEPNKPVYIVCAFSSNFKTKKVKETVCNELLKTDKQELEAIHARHLCWWQKYWEQSYVNIPDKVIEKQYYLSLYGMGSCSRDKDFPPSIFGSWITRERPLWNGDYHLNYNHIAPYYMLYSANRIEQADPYYYPLLLQEKRGTWYSDKITGIPDGLILPVGIGPLGIETVRQNEMMEKHTPYIKQGNVESGGLFYGQKSNSAYCVTNMAMQFYTTYDESFARRVWPFVKKVATFWEKYLRYENGRYVIYNDAIHEGTIGTKNPILSLGLVKMVMQLAIDMSTFLNEDIQRQATWQKISAELSPFPIQQKEGKTVFRYTEKGVAWWNDNTLGIQHIYPAGAIHAASDSALIQVAHNTLDVMKRWTDFNGTNSFYPAAVRVGYNPDTIYAKLHDYSLHIYPNGFQLNNPHGIENYSTVPNTVNEMMCTAYGGTLRLFSCWPMTQNASFVRIRTYGAFLVSASLHNGEVGKISLLSEKGRVCRLKNPWKDKSVCIKGTVSGRKIYSGETLCFNTTQGESFTITELN